MVTRTAATNSNRHSTVRIGGMIAVGMRAHQVLKTGTRRQLLPHHMEASGQLAVQAGPMVMGEGSTPSNSHLTVTFATPGMIAVRIAPSLQIAITGATGALTALISQVFTLLSTKTGAPLAGTGSSRSSVPRMLGIGVLGTTATRMELKTQTTHIVRICARGILTAHRATPFGLSLTGN